MATATKDRKHRKKLTVSIDPDVYEGLHRVVGQGKISIFLEQLARPFVIKTTKTESYAALAQYEEQNPKQQQQWEEWEQNTLSDIPHETW